MWTRLMAAAALALTAGTAGAATVTQTKAFGQSGEDLTFTFSGLPAALGGGTITIFTGPSAQFPGLDLTGFSNSREFFELTFDGLSQGLFSCGGDAGVGATPIPGANFDQGFDGCQFSLPVAVGATELASLLADGVLSVGALFSEAVNAFSGDFDTVGVTIDYAEVAPIPLPASGLLLLGALGAGGLAARRRAA